jgi:hypothetical protein
MSMKGIFCPNAVAMIVTVLLTSACAQSLDVPAACPAERGDYELATQRQVILNKSSEHATTKTLGQMLLWTGTAALATGAIWLAANATNDQRVHGAPVGIVLGGAFATGAGVALLVDASAKGDELATRRAAYAARLNEKAEADKPAPEKVKAPGNTGLGEVPSVKP